MYDLAMLGIGAYDRDDVKTHLSLKGMYFQLGMSRYSKVAYLLPVNSLQGRGELGISARLDFHEYQLLLLAHSHNI